MGSASSKKSNRARLERERTTRATSVKENEETETPSSPTGHGQSIGNAAGTSRTQVQCAASSSEGATGGNTTSTAKMADRVDVVLCKENDMKNGEMREFTVDDAKILLVKDNGKFHALGAKCTHYGAPLAKGVYSNGFVRCPWHGACFNVETGDIEDFPGSDSLPLFQVKVDNGNVKLLAMRKELTETKRGKIMCPMDQAVAKKEIVVIVGGGGAAASCAESLRQNNFAGRIIMVTQETSLPYDRPKLSKALGTDAEAIQIRPKEFYQKNHIELSMGKPVTGIDRAKNTVSLADGSTIAYKYLVLATGGRPRTLTHPGADMKNIFYLRSPSDGKAIADNVAGKNVIIVGSSFIGMEVVSCAVGKKASSVTVIGQQQTPYSRTFGPEIGAALKKLFMDNGVKFEMPAELERIVGDEKGNLKEVVLRNGIVLKADVLIVGIGVEPSTHFLRDSGLKMDSNGYIPVNSHMQTNDPSIYACGDIALFPLSSFDDKMVNIQHWQMALKHGKTAGQAIAGRAESIKTVPFFWTVMLGKNIRFTGMFGVVAGMVFIYAWKFFEGYPVGYDKMIIHGSLNELQFVAYFLKNDKLVAVASLGRDPVASQIAECFRSGRSISTADIEKNQKDDWTHLLTWTHL